MKTTERWLFKFERCIEGTMGGRAQYLPEDRAAAEKLVRCGLLEFVDLEFGKYPRYKPTQKGLDWWINARSADSTGSVEELRKRRWAFAGLSIARPGCEATLGNQGLVFWGIKGGLFRLVTYYWGSPYKCFEYFKVALTEKGADALADQWAVCG